jgi:hypothetical protein
MQKFMKIIPENSLLSTFKEVLSLLTIGKFGGQEIEEQV